VIDASRLFEAVNGRYWEDPRVRVYWEDAKTFLQIANKKYDVIISEPTNPWIAGVAGVFSREFFETCREHLAPGGLFTQWVQGYELEDATFYLILETVTGVFPCYSLWNPTRADTILLMSVDPYQPDFARMLKRIEPPRVQKDLAPAGFSTLLPILSFQMADHAAKPSFVRWLGAIQSDFFPVLEYAAPRGFFLGTEAKGVKVLDHRGRSPVNAKLWVQDYLKQYTVGRDEFRQCLEVAAAHTGLFTLQARVWASEWVARYPDDAEAVTTLIELSSPTYEAVEKIRGRKGGEPWDFASDKARCRFGFDDYSAGRNYLNSGRAGDLLTQVRQLMDKYPDAKDADLYRWRGRLEYDLGRYSESVSNLAVAVTLLQETHAGQAVVADAGLELCDSLLAAGDRPRAMSVCEGPLAPFRGDLRVILMESRIRDGFDFGL
jgi:hypothetical protein